MVLRETSVWLVTCATDYVSVVLLVLRRELLRVFMLRASALGMVGGDYQFLFTDVKVRIWWKIIVDD